MRGLGAEKAEYTRKMCRVWVQRRHYNEQVCGLGGENALSKPHNEEVCGLNAEKALQ